MTSGFFTSVPLSKIWVNRAERQRKSLLQIDTLADSISRLGLIHPIVITRDYELKAGERRLTACNLLGWTTIPVQFVDEINHTQLLLLELEENVKRVDISWQEQCEAVSKYHHIRLAENPKWTGADTAKALGDSESQIGRKLMVQQEIKNGHKFITDAPKLSTAINIAQRSVERRKAIALQEIAPQPISKTPIIHADFIEWIESYDGPKFNFVHCDFPYGINFQDHDGQNKTQLSESAYEDSLDVFEALIDALSKAPITESAHLIFWFSMKHYSLTFEWLTQMGWKVDPFPLIWSKGVAGILPDPQRGPRRVYETAFIASRGDRKIVQVATNHVSFWSENRQHQNEKPKEVLKHFFRMFVDEYTIMLDPTCGSGNAIKIADQMGAKLVLGIEKEREFYEEAIRNYHG